MNIHWHNKWWQLASTSSQVFGTQVVCVFLHCETLTLLTTWEVANYKYKGIGSCGGLGSRFCFSNSTVTTTLSGLEGWHGHGMAMNLGTSSPGINTGKLGPLFCRNSVECLDLVGSEECIWGSE